MDEYPKEVRKAGVHMVVNSPEEERVFLAAAWPAPVDELSAARTDYLTAHAFREAAISHRKAAEKHEDEVTAAKRAAADARDAQGRLDAEDAYRSATGEEPPAASPELAQETTTATGEHVTDAHVSPDQ